MWRRREQARETRDAQRRLARLFSDHLVTAEHHLLGILEGRVPWDEVGFDIRWWVDSREGLVNALDKQGWESLRDAYLHLDEINGMTANRSAVDTPRLRSAAAPALPAVRNANQALAALAV